MHLAQHRGGPSGAGASYSVRMQLAREQFSLGERLRTVKSTVDTGAPASISRPRRNPKREAALRAKRNEVHAENIMLLERLRRIRRGAHHSPHQPPVIPPPPKSTKPRSRRPVRRHGVEGDSQPSESHGTLHRDSESGGAGASTAGANTTGAGAPGSAVVGRSDPHGHATGTRASGSQVGVGAVHTPPRKPRKPKASSFGSKPSPRLVAERRKREQKIAEENARIATMLVRCRPHYSTRKWEDEYQRHLNDLRLACHDVSGQGFVKELAHQPSSASTFRLPHASPERQPRASIEVMEDAKYAERKPKAPSSVSASRRGAPPASVTSRRVGFSSRTESVMSVASSARRGGRKGSRGGKAGARLRQRRNTRFQFLPPEMVGAMGGLFAPHEEGDEDEDGDEGDVDGHGEGDGDNARHPDENRLSALAAAAVDGSTGADHGQQRASFGQGASTGGAHSTRSPVAAAGTNEFGGEVAFGSDAEPWQDSSAAPPSRSPRDGPLSTPLPMHTRLELLRGEVASGGVGMVPRDPEAQKIRGTLRITVTSGKEIQGQNGGVVFRPFVRLALVEQKADENGEVTGARGDAEARSAVATLGGRNPVWGASNPANTVTFNYAVMPGAPLVLICEGCDETRSGQVKVFGVAGLDLESITGKVVLRRSVLADLMDDSGQEPRGSISLLVSSTLRAPVVSDTNGPASLSAAGSTKSFGEASREAAMDAALGAVSGLAERGKQYVASNLVSTRNVFADKPQTLVAAPPSAPSSASSIASSTAGSTAGSFREGVSSAIAGQDHEEDQDQDEDENGDDEHGSHTSGAQEGQPPQYQHKQHLGVSVGSRKSLGDTETPHLSVREHGDASRDHALSQPEEVTRKPSATALSATERHVGTTSPPSEDDYDADEYEEDDEEPSGRSGGLSAPKATAARTSHSKDGGELRQPSTVAPPTTPPTAAPPLPPSTPQSPAPSSSTPFGGTSPLAAFLTPVSPKARHAAAPPAGSPDAPAPVLVSGRAPVSVQAASTSLFTSSAASSASKSKLAPGSAAMSGSGAGSAAGAWSASGSAPGSRSRAEATTSSLHGGRLDPQDDDAEDSYYADDFEDDAEKDHPSDTAQQATGPSTLITAGAVSSLSPGTASASSAAPLESVAGGTAVVMPSTKSVPSGGQTQRTQAVGASASVDATHESDYDDDEFDGDGDGDGDGEGDDDSVVGRGRGRGFGGGIGGSMGGSRRRRGAGSGGVHGLGQDSDASPSPTNGLDLDEADDDPSDLQRGSNGTHPGRGRFPSRAIQRKHSARSDGSSASPRRAAHAILATTGRTDSGDIPIVGSDDSSDSDLDSEGEQGEGVFPFHRSALLRMLHPRVSGGDSTSLEDALPAPLQPPRAINVGGGYVCTPSSFYEPRTVQHVQRIVRQAAAYGRDVRVIGSASSGNASSLTDGVMISMARMKEVLVINREKCTVKAQAGVTLGELAAQIQSHGLSIPLVGISAEHTLGGAVSTGAHGSSAHIGSIASLVREVQIVLASGAILRASRKRNAAAFAAALCSIGAVGVITDVVLQCVHKFDVVVKERQLDVASAFKNLRKRCLETCFMSMVWVPYANTVLELQASPVYSGVVSPLSPPPTEVTTNRHRFLSSITGFGLRGRCRRLWAQIVFFFVVTLFIRVVATIANWIPGVVPRANRTWLRTLHGNSTTSTQRPLDAMDTMRSLKRSFVEWTLPIDRCPEAFNALRTLVHQPRFLRFAFPVELQFLTDAWMGGLCCAFIVQVPSGVMFRTDHREFFDAVDKLFAGMGATFHVGSSSSLAWITTTKHRGHVRLADFEQVRQALDPRQIFVNSFVRQVLAVDEDDG